MSTIKLNSTESSTGGTKNHLRVWILYHKSIERASLRRLLSFYLTSTIKLPLLGCQCCQTWRAILKRSASEYRTVLYNKKNARDAQLLILYQDCKDCTVGCTTRGALRDGTCENTTIWSLPLLLTAIQPNGWDKVARLRSGIRVSIVRQSVGRNSHSIVDGEY